VTKGGQVDLPSNYGRGVNVSTLIAQWCKDHGLDVDVNPQLGYRAVVVDNVRVRLGELPTGALVVESQVAPLPLSDRDREVLVDKALRLSFGRMRASRARCVTDSEATALWLQIVLPGTASQEQLSVAVEDIVNEVERWRKAF
jgi:hypothetical protein